MFKTLMSAVRYLAKANDNDALIPEIWSREALMTLMSQTVMASLVHRDFSNLVANEGDVVNTSRPADFSGKRKTDTDSVTVQDAKSPNIPVPLNQHFHVSYIIKDGELSKALPDLLERYMEPAAREIAEKIDQLLAGQVARLLGNQVGEPNAVTSLNVDDYILDADEKLNDNRAPKFGRFLVMSSRFNRAALGAEIVVEADKRGDQGTALREASVGRIYGFDSFMDQNVPYVNPANVDVSVGVTSGNEAEGDTEIETDVAFADVVADDWVCIEGSEYNHRVASVVDNAGDATITLTEGITADVAAGAVVTVTKASVIDDPGGDYVAGYAKEIAIDGYTSGKHPQLGQLVQFEGSAGTVYSVIDVEVTTATSSTVLLDRPLDVTITNNLASHFGCAGSRNIAFTRDSIALVSRPLATVANQMGARSAVTSFDNLSMRVTMQYLGLEQGTLVTFDLLCGVAILDDRLATVVNG